MDFLCEVFFKNFKYLSTLDFTKLFLIMHSPI